MMKAQTQTQAAAAIGRPTLRRWPIGSAIPGRGPQRSVDEVARAGRRTNAVYRAPGRRLTVPFK